jgi:AMMECR1 domain-containing protein
MEEVKNILTHYGLSDSGLVNYADHSHDPDMWSHTFEIDDKQYVLLEVESIGEDLQDDEYSRLKEDLGISRENMRLVMPKLEQMKTNGNQAGKGIDGHHEVINQDDFIEYSKAYDEAQASKYFPPISPEELPKFEGKTYKNPNQLDTETTWVLFELK